MLINTKKVFQIAILSICLELHLYFAVQTLKPTGIGHTKMLLHHACGISCHSKSGTQTTSMS